MWSQSAGSGLACISCVTGTNAPDCAATRMAGPAETTAQNKNVTTRYALFIVLPPLVDGYELPDRAFKLGTNPLKKYATSLFPNKQLPRVQSLSRSINVFVDISVVDIIGLILV